jgi:SPP1 gp7 family putative phage head morphogenesis protein
MNNADYWRGRFSILEDSSHRQAERTIRGMEEMYLEAQRSVQKEIEAWYGRFADNNQISLSEARKWLTNGQLEEFRWTVDQYIKIGEQANLSPEWLKKLENASAKFHVSRLEAVQTGIQQQIELLYGNQVDDLDQLLKNIVGGGYTRTAYEIQKGVGLGWDITALNQKKLETLLSKPWTTDGRTFRDRCWLMKEDLVNSVSKSLTQGLLRGDAPAKITTAIQKQFGVHRYKAGRLVNTETTYFNAVASRECYRDLDVQNVEIIETLDSHTCEICGGFDGTVIPISQYEPGVTVPPFHPNCRGTTAPAIDEKYAGERAARNDDGEQIYYVPANMKYPDWKATFVNGGSKDGLTVAGVTDIIGNMKRQDVTNEYLEKSTPGEGAIQYDGGYDVEAHSSEIATAEWLHDSLGGDIVLLTESSTAGVKMADYLWNGKLWDLKTTSTEKSANTAIKRGLAQIKSNPGGIILDYGEHDISLDVLQAVIDKRMQWLSEGNVTDIMIVRRGKVVKVLRYKR